jgi:hypothetical protein
MKMPVKVLKDVFTGPDGQTYAAGRVIGGLAFVGQNGLFAMAVKSLQTVDLMALGGGYAAGIASIAALIGATNHTEPKE